MDNPFICTVLFLSSYVKQFKTDDTSNFRGYIKAE
jgi:hypothetical protein